MSPSGPWSTVDTCINKSFLWRHFEVLRLTQNISVRASGDVRLGEFDQWLLSLGDGTAPMVSGEDIIELPEDLCSVIDKADEKKSMTEFCEEIFPDLNRNVGDEKWLQERAVLVQTNHKYDDKLSSQLITTFFVSPCISKH